MVAVFVNFGEDEVGVFVYNHQHGDSTMKLWDKMGIAWNINGIIRIYGM